MKRAQLLLICAFAGSNWGITAELARGQCLTAHLEPSDTLDHNDIGASVSVFGDTAVIGGPLQNLGNQAGSAWVFVRNEHVWTEQATLNPSDGATGDFFGTSVAIHGNTAVVGAYGSDHAGNSAGAAYVFVREGSNWSEQAKLTASDAASSDWFGWSVAISGDTIVVGAHRHDHLGVNNVGAAYVYTRNNGVWSEQAKLMASDGAAGDQFGYSVSIDGDTAAVGAYLDDHFDVTGAGSAYVFVREGGVWTEEAKLIASDFISNDFFGSSISISGDVVMVGAWIAGSAYAFVRDGGVWEEEAKLIVSDAPSAVTVYSVSVHDDVAVLGVQIQNIGNMAQVFVRNGGTWSRQAELTSPAPPSFFGTAVSISGDTIAVGEPNGNSAYLFLHNCATYESANEWKADHAQWEGYAFDSFHPGGHHLTGCLIPAPSVPGPSLALTGGTVTVKSFNQIGTEICCLVDDSSSVATSDGLIVQSSGGFEMTFSPEISGLYAYFASLAPGKIGRMRLYDSSDSSFLVVDTEPSNGDLAIGRGWSTNTPIKRVMFETKENGTTYVGVSLGLAAGVESLGTVNIAGYPGPTGSTVQMDFGVVFLSDCDSDGISDAVEIANGTQASPDGDANLDGEVNGNDISPFVAVLMSGSPSGDDVCRLDFSADGQLTVEDVPGFAAALINSP